MEGHSGRDSTTTAPAPSPKRMQVPRSSQLMNRLRFSAPITRPYLREALSRHSTVCRAKRKPLQAALRSEAQRCRGGRFSSCCMQQAAEGTSVSGVRVATMHAPIWSAEMPAFSRARRAASTVMSVMVSPSARWWRWVMPVREVIHSSLVSTILAMSSLVTSLEGRLCRSPGS